MAKEKNPFEAYANNDEDDSETLTDKEKVPRPLVGPETLTRPLGSDD